MARRQQGFENKQQVARWVANLMRPGIGLKRWLLLAVLGTLIIAAGMTIASDVSLIETLRKLGQISTLGGTISDLIRGLAISAVGLGMVIWAMFMLYERVSFGARYGQGQMGVIESLTRQRARSGGPKIVVIGGGTGQSTVLRGLRNHTDDITAIFTVADDGGSSGRLREELGIAPPGDARQCLIALSDSEPLMERMFDHRFDAEGSLHGHSVGNLLLAALTDTEGSFPKALSAAADILLVHGHVAPSTVSTDVRLGARLRDGEEIRGESVIGHAGQPIDDLWIEPADVEANEDAVAAIREADLIVIGPGSLYTSLLPNLLVRGLCEALREAQAPKVYVCNVAHQPGETDEMDEVAHLEALERIGGVEVTHFLVNARLGGLGGHHDSATGLRPGIKLVEADLIDRNKPTRHESAKLAEALLGILG